MNSELDFQIVLDLSPEPCISSTETVNPDGTRPVKSIRKIRKKRKETMQILLITDAGCEFCGLPPLIRSHPERGTPSLC